ncbi:MAG: cytochrome c family protein [Thermodesulfobacteriota bacterium]|nr:cytochrome c family protein [Thermodesulfobacteriota bacterium]
MRLWKGYMAYSLCFGVLVLFAVTWCCVKPVSVQADSGMAYVGSNACQECHEVEYRNFVNYAKKAHSYESILAMKKNLTQAEFRKCFECHTTGFGNATGFRSHDETPHLKNAGCEVCHGPGNLHVDTGDPEDIKGSLTAKDCESCHNSERVAAFDYKPLIYGGAH